MKRKPYPEHKPSGVEWLGNVPEHWEVKKLKYSFQLLTTKTENHANPIALENIESWTGRLIVTETEFDGEGIAFLKDDLLFGKLRPYLAKVLKAELSGEAVGDFFVMRPQQSMNPEYAAFSLRSDDFINIIDGSTFGSKMPRASWEFMGGVKIPLPPIIEQQSIAAFLDRETGRIDMLVAKKERLIELLREKRSALISHAVTKGLDPSVKMKLSGVEWLGDVPDHWAVKRLKWMTSEITDGSHMSPETESGVYDFVSTKDVREDGIDFENSLKTSQESFEYLVRNKCQPQKDDILFSKDGTIGRTVIVQVDRDFVVASSLIIIRPNHKLLYSNFLNFLCQSKFVNQQVESFVKGAGLPRLSIQNLLKVVGLFPPLSEQQSIAAFLDRETGKIDALIAKVEDAITKLREYRTALISAAVTGKIDVREAA